MEGDSVSIHSQATEINGEPVYTAKLSEKPQFMLDEEYNQEIIGCAIEAVRATCLSIYPFNIEMQKKMAEMIAKMI